MKILYIIIFLSLISFFCFGQVIRTQKYYFSDSLLNRLKVDPLYSSQIAAIDLSYIGDYRNVLKIWDSQEDRSSNIELIDSINFSKYKAIDAMEYIIKRAKYEKIILINEAHHQPYHRVFTASLLHDLFKLDYKYFGAEAVNYLDTSLLNFRKYPLLRTGIFLQEPQYGNLIRSALQEGFYVFAYEPYYTYGKPINRVEREIQQAYNIKEILDKDPKAKIIIHCGYDHLAEVPVDGFETMAVVLKRITGINPFTIDQTQLTEHSTSEYENIFFKLANFENDAVFIDSSGNLFNEDKGFYDICVYHPRTKWIDGRPNWLFKEQKIPFFINDLITIDYPCLVLAYINGEKLEAVNNLDKPIPFDIIELLQKNDKKALVLKKGSYMILIKDVKGKEQRVKVKL